jgi:hypothetical protein
LARELLMFPQEGRQFEGLQTMGEQDLGGILGVNRAGFAGG